MIVFDAGYGGSGDIIVITHSTEGSTANTSVAAGVHSGGITQKVTSHKDMETEPISVLFREYDPLLASLFGGLF